MTVNRMFCDPPTRQGSNLRASAAFPFPPRRGPRTGSTALLMNPAPLSIIHFYFIIMLSLRVKGKNVNFDANAIPYKRIPPKQLDYTDAMR